MSFPVGIDRPLRLLYCWFMARCGPGERPELRRCEALDSRAARLDAAAWDRVDVEARRVVVAEAMRHATAHSAAACADVLAWLESGANDRRRALVRRAVDFAREAAATESDWHAAMAALSAVGDNGLVLDAASSAVRAAGRSQAGDASMVAADAATDRIFTAVLDAIEAECDRAEAAA